MHNGDNSGADVTTGTLSKIRLLYKVIAGVIVGVEGVVVVFRLVVFWEDHGVAQR